LEKGAGGGDVREGGFDNFVVRLMQARHECNPKHGEKMEEAETGNRNTCQRALAG
jgi:hypothetical protein